MITENRPGYNEKMPAPKLPDERGAWRGLILTLVACLIFAIIALWRLGPLFPVSSWHP